MTCIKTGASVYFYNYAAAVRADVYKVGDCYVVRWNTQSVEYRNCQPGDWEVTFWEGNTVWHRDDLGVSVVPSTYMVEGS